MQSIGHATITQKMGVFLLTTVILMSMIGYSGYYCVAQISSAKETILPASQLILGITLIAIACFIGLGFSLIYRVVAPLRAVLEAISPDSSGHIVMKELPTDSQSEIGQLGANLNHVNHASSPFCEPSI